MLVVAQKAIEGVRNGRVTSLQISDSSPSKILGDALLEAADNGDQFAIDHDGRLVREREGGLHELLHHDDGEAFRCDQLANNVTDPVSSEDDYLAYARYTETEIPNYWQYARTFALADHFFTTTKAPSFPGHFASVVGFCDSPFRRAHPRVIAA